MMKLPIFVTVLAFSAQLNAQTVLSKQVVCGETSTVLQSLTSGEYQEKPNWIGRADNDDSKYALFVNKKTKSWTFIQFNDKMACILGSGIGSKSLDDVKPISR